MSTRARVMLCTCPPSAAEGIAEELLRRRLVACVSLVRGVESRYWWKGAIQREEETLLFLKTEVDRMEPLLAALGELHPNEVPELLSLPVEAGHPAYLAWLTSSIADDAREAAP